ncbi:MAG TPA: branched-chain amino acid transaminase [Bacteroidetes bacterium]|nr:branched-chain amino acid transaminase [Bacteroidota bacterium]
MFDENSLIWHNGEYKNWRDATLHVMSHVVHYGSSLFEGIRCYNKESTGPVVLCLQEHIRRLYRSAKIYRIEIPFSEAELISASLGVVQKNGLQDAYIRPVVYRGYGSLGVDPGENTPVEVAVAAWSWGAYLGESALKDGVDACVASWQKLRPNTLPALSKAGGHYLGSQLVKMEARRHGYAEGILLDANGFVSEGSGENLFLILDGRCYTPPVSASILPGITRKCVMTLADELGLSVEETYIPRDMLYIADELFFTGTAAEITPVRSVDRIDVGNGKPGEWTQAIQRRFFDIISGTAGDEYNWLTPVSSFSG